MAMKEHTTDDRVPEEDIEGGAASAGSADDLVFSGADSTRTPVARDAAPESYEKIDRIVFSGERGNAKTARDPVPKSVGSVGDLVFSGADSTRTPVAHDPVPASGEGVDVIRSADKGEQRKKHRSASEKEDVSDYKFITRHSGQSHHGHKRRRSHHHGSSEHHSHHHSSSGEQATPENESDNLVLMSERSNDKGKRRSHHHGSSEHHSHHHSSSGEQATPENGSDNLVVMSHRSNDKGKRRSHHKRRRKKMKRWKKILLIVVSVMLALVIALGGTFLCLRFMGQNALLGDPVDLMLSDAVNANVQDDGESIVYKGQTYHYNKNITTMLFMGVDRRSDDKLTEEGLSGQADVLVMIAIDMKTHNMKMVALPRDTFTEVATYTPEGKYSGMMNGQVCLAYAYGDGKEKSCENTVASVRRVFYNIPIKTYYSLDLDGIAAMNDSVGGVDVTSPETIGSFTEGGRYHLQGALAESFVRTRRQDRVDANMLRLTRQKEYARGFMAQMLSAVKKDVFSSVNIFNESAPYSCTNLNASHVTYLATEFAFAGSPDMEILTVPGEMIFDNDVPRYKVDEEKFFEQFLNVYYEKA